MYQVKRPCKDCPFVKGSSTNITLAEGRIEDIINELHSDKTFSCHKTVNYNDLEDTSKNNFCAGAMNYLIKEGKPNQPMQIAERLGWLDISTLRGQEDIIDIIPMKMPWERMLEERINSRKVEELNELMK
ncbi:hypothetical protein QTG56_23785 (plasmid) [Rossellomorea sp. AcN35-11]|nr:hypothetical protein [Rossellomorea aquimaris]WJV32383.1 hypothetical protein QTG56_23785 [Rossellomorea sp. AcN35-11]